MKSSVTGETEVVSATLRMKVSAARIMPNSTAVVRSAITVSPKVTSHTAIADLVSCSRRTVSAHCPML